jgi:hypothetical protein
LLEMLGSVFKVMVVQLYMARVVVQGHFQPLA